MKPQDKADLIDCLEKVYKVFESNQGILEQTEGGTIEDLLNRIDKLIDQLELTDIDKNTTDDGAI